MCVSHLETWDTVATLNAFTNVKLALQGKWLWVWTVWRDKVCLCVYETYHLFFGIDKRRLKCAASSKASCSQWYKVTCSASLSPIKYLQHVLIAFITRNIHQDLYFQGSLYHPSIKTGFRLSLELLLIHHSTYITKWCYLYLTKTVLRLEASL